MAYYGNRGNFPPPLNPFVPPPEFFMQMLFSEMLQKKHEAQAALNRNQLAKALSLYSEALAIAQDNFPGHDEIPKLLSNRALVYLKRGQFAEALRDSKMCCEQYPLWIKGFWRCAQAYKGLHDMYSALNILVVGLSTCVKENVLEEKVTFLAEIVSTVMQVSDDPNDCLDSIDPPEEEHVQIKVLQRLASSGCWEGVSLLLIGEHQGPISNLDECFSTCPTQSLSVGSLIQSVSDIHLRKWGQKLIITLLKNGASYTDMEYKIGKPAVHIGIHLSLKTGTTDLLKHMFKQYITTDARKNAVDQNMDSAFHFLLRSGRANSTLGETLLRLLLNNSCNPNMVDSASKRPIDYVNNVDQAYSVLHSAQRDEDENIKEKLQKLKDEGNKAHREGNNHKANEAYTKALQLIQNNRLPPKEAAIFLSNRSAVQSACGNTMKALDDAELSVHKDPTWHKGHWRRAQLLRQLDRPKEAFLAFMEGYNKSTACPPNDRLNFLVEATISFSSIRGVDDKEEVFEQFESVPRDETWQAILFKLSKQGEWVAIRHLLLGVRISFDKEPFPLVAADGPAAYVSSSITRIQMASIFPYLRKNGDIKKLEKWVTPLFFFIITTLPPKPYSRWEESYFIDLSEEDEDTPLNGVAKFSAILGDLTIIKTFEQDCLKTLKFQDINGNSPYHALYIMNPRPSVENLLLVTKYLLSIGLSISTKNNVGHMPLHYLRQEDGQLFRIVKSSTKAISGGSSINKDPVKITMQDVLQLKTKGNEAFHMGRYPEAIQHYSDAICALEYVKTDESTGRHYAVLYGNRAECHMKLGHNAAARNDAVESVSYDGHWYKAHLRVGKAQAACGNIEIAFKATLNSFDSIDESEPENVRQEVLGELMKHSEKMIIKQPQANIKAQLRNLKSTPGELWAKVAYDLIKENLWSTAKEAYQNFNIKSPSIIRFSVDLKPLCNLDQLEKESGAWIVDLMTYFLCCGSDHKQITLQKNDTYLHAVVRMSLVSGALGLLEYIVSKVVKPNQEHNIVDEKGNTALHVATREGRTQPVTRLHAVIYLVEETDIDTMKKNKDGKLAVEYLPKGEVSLAEFLINRMTTQDGLEKQMKKQRLKQEEDRKRQEMDRKKQEIERKRKEDIEKRNQQGSQRGQKMEQDIKVKKGVQKENIKQQSRGPPADQCIQCLQSLEQAKVLIEESKRKAYNEFAKILHKKHNSPQHKKIEEDVLQIVIRSMGRVLNPEIPEKLAKIPIKLYEKLVAGLASAEKWQQMQIAVQEYRRHHGDLALMDFAKSLSVAKVISTTTIQDQQLVVQIIKNMLQSGAELSQEGRLAVLGAVQEYRFRVLEELFRQGANPAHLTLINGDTPMTAALCIALERDKGNFSLLNLFFELYEQDPDRYSVLDPSLRDKDGNSLFHIVARAKYNSTTQKATELLCDKKVSALVYNKEGKLPRDYLNKKNDRRLQFFRLASVGSTAEKAPSKRKQEKNTSDIQDSSSAQVDDEVTAIVKEAEENNNEKSSKQSKSHSYKEKVPSERKMERFVPAKASQRREAIRSHIEDMIYSLPDIPYSIFNPRQPVLGDDNMLKKLRQKRQQSQEDAIKKEPEKELQPAAVERGEAKVQELEEEEEGEDEDIMIEEQEEFTFDPQVFDNLEWEVECTAEVWRTLRDKHVLPELKQRVIRKIQLLAKGEWRPHLCKELRNVPETLKLYEAKISKGGRILWELAIAFSPRLSESAERRLQLGETDKEQPVRGGRIYSEVIRVWDVVFDHDKIYRSVQRIIKSHHRGEECIIQKKLKGIKQDQFQGGVTKRIPMIFTETDAGLDQREVQEWQQELQKYFPPASSNETEYHILKFYAFSSNLVSHVLQNLEMKVDFPFRVTDLEHAIINLQSSAPILLLGRSGTGKTTCCLYRLWSQFVSYWTSASKAESKLLPRCIVYREDQGTEETNDVVDEEEDIEEDEEENEDQVPGISDMVDPEAEEEGQIYDHLQQLFITKNSVLCAEVQKNFRELSHACDLAKDHVAMETQSLPYRLQDVNEFQFPLFITSRQLLLMLDASLEPPYFFDRNEDGSMRVDVQGWTDSDSPLAFHPLMEDDSEDEDEKFEDNEMDEDLELEGEGPQNQAAKQKVDPRKEVTYQIFAEEVWPHICKKYAGKYHPSLVWMEVMSFIKGSFEALSKTSGSLNLQEYLSLGKKRAPNFSGEREHIYKIFSAYEHFKKQRFLFDETDLVRNVYSRLKKEPSLKWIIHQIYVDETQDFTQAELCLLLHICNNPNQMFLTGDTAQSIMRGISFRFNDLRSLFFYARGSMHAVGKTSAVEVPKQVYQLTHNYRSHAGILSLASSILDLMIEFFPESFDRLGKDQGLFQGPAPVLLESCSFSDLAMLLRGNKRKTSHIEFGAHQAILVVNDAARENIPEELQLGLILTIYEAKGLEFDDILLYNFFNDSQANKEWRVITEYLERLYSIQMEKTPKAMSESSLVQLDADVLQQAGRPRALTFDPNQHKVLNSELKHLYTAVTRARVNVWIFDSHSEKRASMFEYFKARKLVRSITSEDVEGASCEGVFAEESSEEEWIKRGEDFMKHSLYEVAAKCFLRGGDVFMQNVAMAHQKALNASRMKDNPSKMREEFLHAAESFLECELPTKAVICLQNARERELVAHLYEKTGQLERAGETYRRLRRPVEGSRCYEQLGKFNLAVETLYENEMYDMAIDTLQRYKMLLEELRRKGQVIPPVLYQYGPHRHHTLEQLSYKAAELYHSLKNQDKMMGALARLPNLEDQTRFLIQRNYTQEAAKLLQRYEQYEKAADLYVTQGMTREALECARKSGNKWLIGKSLLIDATLAVRKHELHHSPDALEDICQDLETAFDLFQQQDKKDEAGEAALLRGQITGKIVFINKAFGAFSKSLVKNEAGMLECMDWMVNQSNLLDDKNSYANLGQVIKGMANLFGILRVLLKQKDEQERVREEKILRFYGLTYSPDRLFLNVCPQQKPMALKMLRKVMSEKNRKSMQFSIECDKALPEVCKFLVERGLEWKVIIDTALLRIRERRKQCPDYALGRPCSRDQVEEDAEEPTCVEKCVNFHSEFSYEQHNALLDTDEMMIELDYYVQHGVHDLDLLATKEMQEELSLQRFVPRTLEAKYVSCTNFVQDLIPDRCFLSVASCNLARAKDLKSWFNSRRKWFKEHFASYISEFYRHMKTEERKWNTKFFVRFMILHQLMDLKLKDQNPFRVMTKFENEIKSEFKQKITGIHQLRKTVESLGFITAEIDRDLHIECLSHRFYDAFDKLSGLNNDPGEALIKFSKFVTMLAKTKKSTLMPYYGDFLIWMEFFTTVTMSLIAKTYIGDKFFFVLPESYIATVYFVDATFVQEQGVPTFEAIQRFKPWRSFRYDLYPTRLGYITKILWSEMGGLNLIKSLFKTNVEDGCIKDGNYGLAERVLTLALVCLCNIGHSISADKETDFMKQIYKIKIRDKYPPRLCRVLNAVQTAQSQQEVACALMALLRERENEGLLYCEWRGGRDGIWHEPLLVKKLNPAFYNDATLTYRVNPFLSKDNAAEVDTEPLVNEEEMLEDLSITMEEKIKRDRQQKEEEMQEKQKYAVECIIRCLRSYLLRIKVAEKWKLGRLVEKQINKEKLQQKMKIFESVEIMESHCGICGVPFLVSDSKGDRGDENIVPSGFEPEHPSLQRQQSLSNQISENQSKMEHIYSVKHNDQVKAYQMFRLKFFRDLTNDLDEITNFIHKYKLTTNIGSYPDQVYKIDHMLRTKQEADVELRRILYEKDWNGNQKFVEMLKESKGDLMQVRSYIEETAKAHRKEKEKTQAESASKLLSRNSPENWDEELVEVIPAVDDPSLRKSRNNPGKGRGKGRGRGKKKENK